MLSKLAGAQRVCGIDDAGGTVQQCRPQFKRGSVEGYRSQLKESFLSIQPCIVCLNNQAHHAAVKDFNPFGYPGGPRGVHHIGKGIRRRPSRHVLVILPNNSLPVRIQTQHFQCAIRNGWDHPALCQQNSYPGVFHHERETSLGVCRIQRHIRPASLEDAQQTHHHLQGALHADPHQHLRPHAKLPKVMGKLVRPAVEFPVGQPLVLKDQSYCIGGPFHLFLKQFVNAFVPGVICLRGVPCNQELVALGFSQNGYLRHTCIQVTWYVLKDCLKVP